MADERPPAPILDAEAQRYVYDDFDPVFARLSLQRVGLDYYPESFNVIARYESDKLRVSAIRDRGRWELNIASPSDGEGRELESILDFLDSQGIGYRRGAASLARRIEANFEILCDLFSPAKYSSFQAQFDLFLKSRFLKSYETGLRTYAKKMWPRDERRQDDYVNEALSRISNSERKGSTNERC